MINNLKKLSIKLSCFFICTIVLLSSCTANDTVKQDEPTIDSSKNLYHQNSINERVEELTESEENDNEYQSSNTLKLYFQERSSYNPLNTFDYSGRAIFKILYRSLFSIDEENVLKYDLVENANYITEKKLYEIELKADNFFSDGTIINSTDCKASILAYRDYLQQFIEDYEVKNDVEEDNEILEDDEAISNSVAQYSDEIININLLKNDLYRLNQITEINVIDEMKFSINLATSFDEEDVNYENNFNETINSSDNDFIVADNLDSILFFSLTMPIIKSDDINNQNFLSSTSGEYYLSKKNDQGYLLQSNNSENSLKNILLVEFKNCQNAIYALENNEIDMVYLDENNFNLYNKQNSRKMISFSGQRYYYLKFGQNKQINDSEFQDALKQLWLIRDDLTKNLIGQQTLSYLPLKSNDAAISKFNLFTQTKGTSELYSYFQKFKENKISIDLIAPESVLEQEWSMQLRESLLDYNIDVNINIIDINKYQYALEEGKYDLAINWIDLNYPINLIETLQKIDSGKNQNFNENEQYLSQLLNQYFNTINREVDNKIIEDNVNDIQNMITNYFNNLNILGIGFSEAGILMSNRVENVPNSNINNPYNQMEELWVQH